MRNKIIILFWPILRADWNHSAYLNTPPWTLQSDMLYSLLVSGTCAMHNRVKSKPEECGVFSKCSEFRSDQLHFLKKFINFAKNTTSPQQWLIQKGCLTVALYAVVPTPYLHWWEIWLVLTCYAVDVSRMSKWRHCQIPAETWHA